MNQTAISKETLLNRRPQDGFTLIEVMVASILLAFMAVAIMSTQIYASRAARINSQFQTARNIAQKYVEQLTAAAAGIPLTYTDYYPTNTSLNATLDPFATLRANYATARSEPLSSLYAGSLTAATTSRLTDSAATWPAGKLAGFTVFIVNGTGSGQSGTITANTATQLTISPALTTSPAVGSGYRITNVPGTVTFTFSGVGRLTAATANTLTDSNANWTANQWANSEVYIVSDTGGNPVGAAAGQYKTITSNTNNRLTLASNLTTVPTVGGISNYRIDNGQSVTITISWTFAGKAYTQTMSTLLIPSVG